MLFPPFFQPLQLETWLALIVSFLLSTSCLVFLTRLSSHPQDPAAGSWQETVLYMFSTTMCHSEKHTGR